MKPSDVSNLLQQVVEEINENEFHPLHRFCSYNYYTDFFSMAEILFAHGYFNTQKERKSFFNRMQFNSKFSEMRYYQGVSELLFIYFALDHQLTFVTDKKLLLNSNNDIDLQITDNGFHYNVEIKCPAFDVCNSPEILKIDPLFRTVTDKELYKREMSKALNEVAQPVIKNSDGRFKGYKIKKIADEKLRDFLKSGQSKFPASDNTSINILAIAVPITNLENYWAYLYNAFSGLFVKSNNGICPPTDYDKIDVVYLTALVTGHTKPKDTYNSWKLSSYCNLLCKNPFSRKYQNGFYEGYKSALELFPNSTSCFEEFYSGVSESADKAQRPLQGLMFPTFFDEYFPYLWR